MIGEAGNGRLVKVKVKRRERERRQIETGKLNVRLDGFLAQKAGDNDI
jgi:hypothetical protein